VGSGAVLLAADNVNTVCRRNQSEHL